MQIHTLSYNFKSKKPKRVGRGGKRGTYSGRGTKGQKARAGHRIRPAMRDFLIRLPKLRGFHNRPLKEKMPVVSVGELEKKVKGTVVNEKTLGNYKILGDGTVTKAFTIEGLSISQSAKIKIEAAGGKVVPAVKKPATAPESK